MRFRIATMAFDRAPQTVQLVERRVGVALANQRRVGVQRTVSRECALEHTGRVSSVGCGRRSIGELRLGDSRDERMRVDSHRLDFAKFGRDECRSASRERIEDPQALSPCLLGDQIACPGPAEAGAVAEPAVDREAHVADEAARRAVGPFGRSPTLRDGRGGVERREEASLRFAGLSLSGSHAAGLRLVGPVAR